MSKEKLPSVLYAKWDGQDDDRFLNTDDEPSMLAEPEESIIVGKYELIQRVKLINRTTVQGE